MAIDKVTRAVAAVLNEGETDVATADTNKLLSQLSSEERGHAARILHAHEDSLRPASEQARKDAASALRKINQGPPYPPG